MSADEVHPVAGQRTDIERQKEEEFFKACSSGDITSVKALIEANVDINATKEEWPYDNCTALDCATFNGHLEIVNTLVTAGIDINKELQNVNGDTVGGQALETALKGGHLDIANALITAGVDLNKKLEDWYGYKVGGGALVRASNGGHLDIVNALITAGVDLNEKLEDEYRDTVGGEALVRASEGGHLDIVNALITAGVDLNKELEDEYGNTEGGEALVRASEGGHLAIVNALITAGVDLNKELEDEYCDTVGGQALVRASEIGHLDIVNALIAAGVDLNKELEDEYGDTVGGQALVRASERGHLDIVNALITAELEDEYSDTVGGQALVRASEIGHLDIVNALIAAGVDLNKELEDEYGNTVGVKALMRASEGGHLDIVITSRIDRNKELEDEYGNTVGEKALVRASERGYLDIVNALITAGVDLNKRLDDEYGDTVGGEALRRSSEEGYLDIVNALITAGVDLNKEDERGNTVGEQATVEAARYGHLECVNSFITAGVNLNKMVPIRKTYFCHNDSCIHVSYSGPLGLVFVLTDGQLQLSTTSEEERLKRANTDLNEKGETVGGKALVGAAAQGETDMINTLVDMGVDLKEKNEIGETVGKHALLLAAAFGKTAMINALINIGVGLKERNVKGETVGGQALVDAAARGKTDMINTLVDMGVDLKEKNEKGESVGGQALVRSAATYYGVGAVNLLIGLGVDLSEEFQNGTVGESALFKVLERDWPERKHLKIVDTFVRQEVHINKRDTFIEACEKKIKQIKVQEVKPYCSDLKTNIAIRYKMYELFTGKTKEAVIERMTRDMEQIKDSQYKFKYKEAIKCYKDDIPAIIKAVRLNEEQEMQMAEAFASGSERDFCVRSNFVGFTGAGKTTVMWQLFLIIFSPKDIESTNGIDISLGYCSIDLRTEQWKRRKESAYKKRARRFQAIAVDKKTKRDKNSTSGIAIDLTKPSCSGIQTQQQQQQRISDNLSHQQKTDTISEPAEVPDTKTRIPISAKPPNTKTDQYRIVHRIKQAKTKAGRREQEANATGIDYAGQATYYALHQLFLSKRGVNIIVMDGSKDFDENIKDEDVRHIGSKQKANSKDFFRFWANSLRYYLPERSSKHIITVFTHKDLVLNQDDLQKKICIVKEMIEDMGMTELFFEKVLCVNGNDPNDQVLQELRHIILQFSKGENHWGQEMPSSWLLLEDKLMQRKAAGHQVMTIDEVNEMHLKSALPLRSQDELLLFLKIHHDIGTLMYFGDVRAMKIAILNPQWLIDCLKSVICAKRFRDPRYIKQWDRLHEKGLVDKAFLYSVWESTPGRFFEFREDLILLMNKLDLISSPKTYDEKGDYVSSPYFIVPCMLHPAPENFLQRYQNAATYRNLPIAFEFIHGFLPTATAYRMLATCVMEFGELKKEETIYCDCAVFKVFEHHYMTLEFTSSSIIANVLTFGKTQASIGVCKAVRGFLEDAMKCIISSQRISTNYSLLVACGYEDKHHKPAWLKWSTLMQQPEIICEEHRNEPPHVVKTEGILNQWSLVRSEEERLQNKRRKIHDRPVPEGKPDQLYLGRISRRIPLKEFHLLFIELGLNTNDIDRIEHNSPVQSILFLLLEWARRPGSTYKQLADALYKQHSYVFDIEEMQSDNCEWRADIPETFLKQEVADTTDLEFDKLCFMAGSSYFALGLELGLMKHEIDAIKTDNKNCLPITREIIKSWINKNRPDDTWEVLGDALYEVGEDPHFIKNMCNASQDISQ